MEQLGAESNLNLDWSLIDTILEEQLSLDIMKLKGDISHLIQVHNHALNFLQVAKKSNKRIYLVTNAHRKGINLKMKKSGLQDYFDDIVSSHDYGVPKQEQKFWEELTKQIGLDKERAIFFDDSLDVLESASNKSYIYVK